MGPKEKIQEMERQRDELEVTIPLKAKEFESLSDKLEENVEEQGRLVGRFEQHLKKFHQQNTFDAQTGWMTRCQTPQEEVDSRREEAALDAEIAANEKEREELKTAWDAKRQELEELQKARKALISKAEHYLLPN
jgi:Ser/Thr protein kinase RdoA (MazF antagonist)